MVLSACSGGSRLVQVPYVSSGDALARVALTGAGKIEHVVYIVQENRSFNGMFMGYPGADTVSSGKNSLGQKVKLQPVSLKTVYDVDHTASAMFAACDGTGKLPGTDCRMDGFNKEAEQEGGPVNGQYVYVPTQSRKPYFDMAHEFVLADRMFASQLDESFVAHQYIIAAQADSSVNVPTAQWGCEGAPGDEVMTITRQRTFGAAQRPCFDYQTLGDEFDTAGLSWHFYTSKYTKPMAGFGRRIRR